jgi:hypothetical protein
MKIKHDERQLLASTHHVRVRHQVGLVVKSLFKKKKKNLGGLFLGNACP